MRTARLQRSPSTDQGTFGRLVTDGFAAYSGELPDRGNARGLSCIPPGDYRVVWVMSPRLKRYTYRLLDVPDRDGVLKHSANLFGDKLKGYVAQLEGCISLGEAIGAINGQAALLRSKPAIRRFEAHMGHAPFLLEIRNA